MQSYIIMKVSCLSCSIKLRKKCLKGDIVRGKRGGCNSSFVRFSVPTAFTAAAILLQSSFFFWLVIQFVSLLCKIAKFSSTFSISVAISVGLKFCFLAFLRGASAKTTISGEATSLSKQTKSIMGCYPRVSRV